MIDLLKDPFLVVISGSVLSAILILVGAANIQDGLKFKGGIYIVIGAICLVTTYILSKYLMYPLIKL